MDEYRRSRGGEAYEGDGRVPVPQRDRVHGFREGEVVIVRQITHEKTRESWARIVGTSGAGCPLLEVHGATVHPVSLSGSELLRVRPIGAGTRPVDHAARGGTCCPFCGWDQIEGESVDTGDGQATQEMTCQQCSGEWTDVYELTGFSVVRIPEDMPSEGR